MTGYTTPQGGTGSITYAGAGYNVSGTSSPTGSRTSYAYTDPNAPNRPSKSTSASGITSAYTWNSAYQPTSSQVGTAGTSRSSYAVSGCPGAVSSTVDAKGGTTTYAYDSRCRLVTTVPSIQAHRPPEAVAQGAARGGRRGRWQQGLRRRSG